MLEYIEIMKLIMQKVVQQENCLQIYGKHKFKYNLTTQFDF